MEEKTKVENVNKENEKRKAKKKMKLWKKILIIILILLAIFIIDTFRKFNIIRQVSTQYEKDSKNTNYYLKNIETNNNGMTEVWKYGSKTVLKNSQYDEKGLTEKMIFSDSAKKEQWIVINSKDQKDAIKLEYVETGLVASTPGIHGGLPRNSQIGSQILISTISNITTDKWAEKECYCISFGPEYRMWVQKSDMRIIGEMNGITYTEKQEKIQNATTHIFKFGETKQEDVELPDLTLYTIKDFQGNVIE